MAHRRVHTLVPMAALLATACSPDAAPLRSDEVQRQTLAAVERCLADKVPSKSCLSAARERCVEAIGVNRVDPFLEAACAAIETAGWEGVRIKAEAKLDAELANDPQVQALVRATRRDWAAYRDAWCEAESVSIPSGATGETMLAKEDCWTTLTDARLARVRQMIEWRDP